MFGIKLNRRPGKVTELDVMLAEALRLYEDSLCPDCRQSIKWAWDIRTSEYYWLDTETGCNVCELFERANKHISENPSDAPEPGTKRHVVNRIPEFQEVIAGG